MIRGARDPTPGKTRHKVLSHMLLLLEYSPLVAFIIGYLVGGIYVATIRADGRHDADAGHHLAVEAQASPR